MSINCHQFHFDYNFWHSEDYLSRVVRELHPDEPQKQIYHAASHASACVRQAKSFLQNADKVDYSLRALLQYYGLLNWYKALIHLFDLGYPATTSVLQHGVSVRRTKRVSYHLHSEAVYVYKEGVIQSAAGLAAVALPQRISFGDAIGFTPGLCDVVGSLYPSSQHIYPVLGGNLPNRGNESGGEAESWYVPRSCAAQRGLTVEEWIDEYKHAATSVNSVLRRDDRSDNGSDAIYSPVPPNGWLRLPFLSASHPWLLADDKVTSSMRDQLMMCNMPPIPKWVSQFVILFCLSSLVRYNPLEWSDIERWHNEVDALFIETYLKRCPEFVVDCVERLYHDMLDQHLNAHTISETM